MPCPPNRPSRRPSPTWRPTFPTACADAARGRHADLRQQRRHGHRAGSVRSTMAATGWSPSGSPTTARPRRLIASGNVADRRPRGHHDLFRRDRHHRRFRRRLRQRAARRDRRQDLFRRRKRRARAAASSRPSTTASTRPASPARKSRTRRRSGASRRKQDHLERQGQDGPLRELALRVLRPAARLLAGLRDRRPDGQAQDRLPVPGHQPTRATSASASSIPYYFALSPTYDLTRHRHRLHRAGLPRRGRMAPALQQRRVQHHASPASTRPIPDAFDFNTVDSGPAGDPNELRGMMGTQGPLRDQSALGLRLGRPRPDRQEFLPHLRHRRLQRLRAPLRGLSDRARRPQLFRPARHAFRGPGRASSTTEPDAARNDKQPWVLPTLRLFLHARRAGVRRRAQFRRQRPRRSAATS